MQEKAKTESLGKLMKDLKVGDRASGQTAMSTAPEDDEDETEEGEGPILDRNDMMEQQEATKFDAFGKGKHVGGAWEDGQYSFSSIWRGSDTDSERAQAWEVGGLRRCNRQCARGKERCDYCRHEYAYIQRRNSSGLC